jgi:formylglycine-generating enzyme required for sulfatase activity
MSHPTWFRCVCLCVVGLALGLSLPAAPQPEVDPEPGSLTNSIGMQFKLVRKGKFRMGAPEGERTAFDGEKPQHEVTITKDFRLGVHEVTQGQYRKLMGTNPSDFSRKGEEKARVKQFKDAELDDFPVENVDWVGAMAFCKKLNEREAKTLGKWKYTLPTEAQWEYACRGGPRSSTMPFHFKKPTDSLSGKQANFAADQPFGDAKAGKYLGRTTRVGSYQPNRLGLHDMHGNVWEWCLDWYDEGYYANSPGRDPGGPAQGIHRVMRGGSWDYFGQCCRAAYRSHSPPSHQGNSVGVRVAVVRQD